MIELGVNIDHVATLRQARGGKRPDIIAAAKICEIAGAHQITVHLRKDRRHIQDRDVYLLKETLLTRMNLEMAVDPEIVDIALGIEPYTVCLVPERDEEITTEGGLDVAANRSRCEEVVQAMHEKDIKVSLFIDPEIKQVDAAAEIGADAVEFHTGPYAAATGPEVNKELQRLLTCADYLLDFDLDLHAGHGLNIHNLLPVACLPFLSEVNIGHDIVARAVFIGLEKAVKEILDILASVMEEADL